MPSRVRTIHLYAGWLFVLIFVLTGQYMRNVIHQAMEADSVLRYSIRANHIYILLLGLLHLCLGAYWSPAGSLGRQRLQLAGSALLLIATTITVGAFFFESKAGADRPALQVAMITAVVGVGLHLLGARRRTSG